MFDRPRILLVLGTVMLFIVNGLGQEPMVKPVMKTYYLVLLHGGPHRDQDSATAAAIQEGHLENIRRLAEAGKLDIAGPFLDDGDLRGIFILNVGTLQEAESLMRVDPAIAAGRLKPEIHPWFSQRGAMLR